MKKQNPIGIFDSGVGGTSIWKEIHELLPNENTIYLADSKNAPYGYKTAEEITLLSIKNTDALLQMGCKIIVVACNTATTNAISTLRSKYRVPIIGIEPAIKPAALKTHNKSIGILATKGTLSSILFNKTSSEFAKEISVLEIVGEGLVPLIEEGKLQGQEMHILLKKYADQLIAAKVDYLVLGCSHYPYIVSQLRELLPAYVTIIDSGEAVARQTKSLLEKHNLLNESDLKPSLRFYSNAKIDTLSMLLSEFSEVISISKKEF